MRLIDYDKALDRYYAEYEKQDICCGSQDRDWLKRCFEEAPTIDAVPVVRCKDCMYHFDVRMFGHQSVVQCAIFDYVMQPDSYCDQGRWEEDGE